MSHYKHDICPHQLFNKSYQQRIRSIPVSFFPDPTIDSFTNVNVKCGKPFKSNIPTVAYQKFNFYPEQITKDRNFVKDFYMENYQQSKMVLNNNIVNELKEQMYHNSAYILAEGATKDYQQFQHQRKRALTTAQSRAKATYKSHFNAIKQEKQKNFQENSYWLKKLFRKLQQVAHHIIYGITQNQNQKQKHFLMSKANLNANFLSQIKVKQPKNACQILQQLKVLMLKKKLMFSDAREQQQLNKSISMSYTSEASQNTSQGSMLSEATSLNQTNNFGQDQIVNKFCDFNQLSKKWNLQDIQSVKIMIRKMLTKQLVFNAEVEYFKNKTQAMKINQRLKVKNNISTVNKNQKKQIKKKPNKVVSIIEKVVNSTQKKSQLTKEQKIAKQGMIKGGQFDAFGQKFMRNKSYSQVFKDKENLLKTTLNQVSNEQQQKILKNKKLNKKHQKMLDSTGIVQKVIIK